MRVKAITRVCNSSASHRDKHRRPAQPTQLPGYGVRLSGLAVAARPLPPRTRAFV